MSNLFNIVLLIVAVIGTVYLLMNRRKAPAIKKIVVIDPEAQKLYNINKGNTDEEKTLTMQEKIELSWKFLVNIKNQVLKQFSKPDQEKVNRIGIILTENGMKYQHDIEQEIKLSEEFSKTKSITKPKEQEQMSR